MLKHKIDRKDYYRYDNGSNENNHSAIGYFFLCRPGNLVYKFVV